MTRSIFLLAVVTLWVPSITSAEDAETQARQDAIVVRAIERMKGYDYSNDPKVQEAIERHIERSKRTADYMSMLKRFRPVGLESMLREMVLGKDNSQAVDALQLLLETGEGPKQVRGMLAKESTDSGRVAEVLGLLGNGRSVSILSDVVKDAERPYDVRRIAVSGLAKNRGGQNRLLELAKSQELVGDSRLIAGALLARSQDEEIRKLASEILPQPQAKDQEPLAPIDELARLKGDVSKGLQLFRGTATCANCHIVGDFGKEVGPNLTEIGSKLSREAMLTSVLDPSAGISHNYEQYNLLTADGQVITGIKISETDDEIVIRTIDAIDRKISTDDIEQLKKNEKSIMPENLHHITGQKGLVDIVEYMASLKKKG